MVSGAIADGGVRGVFLLAACSHARGHDTGTDSHRRGDCNRYAHARADTAAGFYRDGAAP
jgi:hypothetical protein